MEHYRDKNESIQYAALDRTQPTEITSELTLPDYRGEIVRLLWVRPTFTPPEIFVRGTKAELSGTVYYEIGYVDGENALCTAEFTDGYHVSLPLEEGAQPELAFNTQMVTDAVVGRVTAPRRLSVRSRLHTRVMGYADMELSPKMRGDGVDEERICRLSAGAECGRFTPTARETLTLADSMELPQNTHLIGARGTLYLPEVSAATGCVNCRGELIVTLLLCHEGGTPTTTVRRIPFATELVAEQISPVWSAAVSGAVSELHASLQDGELRTQAVVTLNGMAQTQEPVILCRDVFAPGMHAECHFSTEPLWQAGCCCNQHFSISGECERTALPLDGEVEILDVTAEPEIAEKAGDGSRITLSGDLKCHLLCMRGNEIFVTDAAFPFRVSTQQGGEDVMVDACVPVCRATLGPDTMRVDAELQLALRAVTQTPVRSLSEATFTRCESPTPVEGIELYYPTGTETLWSVAKRYGCTPDAIADANGLDSTDLSSPDSLAGKRFLLIP